MLIMIILLVLSAVVLTILGVGFIEYSKANVRKKTIIEKGSVAGRYFNGEITFADAIKLYDNKPLYRLSENEQKAVLYHEAFHEVAERLGFRKEAGKEDYADRAAIYALKDREGTKAALEGLNLVRKMGRADEITNIDTIEKWLEGKPLTHEEYGTIQSGKRKMRNLSAAAEYEVGLDYGENIGLERDMRISQVLRDKDGAGDFRGGGVWKYFKGMFDYIRTSSDKVKGIVDGAVIHDNNQNVVGYEKLKGVGGVGKQFLEDYICSLPVVKKILGKSGG